MAFTGYVFTSKADVEAVAEPAGDGPTFRWCRRQALRLRCLVTCGYVERVADGRLFNAVMAVDRDGSLACNARKTFLYETDKSWATPGAGFSSWHCPWLGGGGKTLALGICMDVNPEDFAAPFEAFEFASFCLEKESDLVLLTCAWCDFEPREASERPTLNYWAARLSPVTKALQSGALDKRDVLFLAANRVGEENGTFFVGASCALALRRPAVVAHASRLEETLLRVSLPE